MVDGSHDWVSTTHEWAWEVDHEHLAAVRERAGELAAGGVAHLVLEVLAYADEEAESQDTVGRAVVTRHADGSVSVADDGRGTDTRRDGDGRVVRKPVMATKDLRFFDADDSPRLPDARPRRGMSTVAALSTWLEHTNHRRDGSWTQRYEHGVPATGLTALPPSSATGTTVHFCADPGLVGASALDDGLLGRFEHLDVVLRDES
ncbi:ATP-binding protein [Cellulosimicrobium terreum]|nr:ATP-binding protein [Cellulosimicrobium terreum]